MDAIFPQDAAMMEEALKLADRARVIAPPNPWVGCVIVNQNQVVGKGFTQPPGKAHAEIVALQQAQNRTKGATAYVTLEPCAHFGRTPPCVDALIQAGISRVVIGIQDPDTHVKGKGIEKLRSAGILVTEGVHAERIAKSLAPYLHHRTTGLPYCILKAAASIDGRIAAQDKTSQWITSQEARLDAHVLRAQSQAIIIGSGTACTDKPKLTVRGVKTIPSTSPLRVILDAHGRVPADGPLFDVSLAPSLIITSSDCPDKIKKSWLSCHVEVETLEKSENGIGVNLRQVLQLLGKRGILQVLVEGGGALLGAFLEANIADHFIFYIGSRILGNKGIPLLTMDSIKTIKDAPELELLNTQMLGNSVRLDYRRP